MDRTWLNRIIYIIVYSVLMSIILPLIITGLKNGRTNAHKKMTDQKFIMVYPKMVYIIGMITLGCVFLLFICFTFFSKETPHYLFYVCLSPMFALGTYLTLKGLTFKVTVSNEKITAHNLFGRPYEFAFSEITSVVRSTKNRWSTYERVVIRTDKGKRLVVEQMASQYKRLIRRIESDVNAAALKGFE